MHPGQMEDPKISFEYRPLVGSEIRLVSFKKDQGSTSPFELQLEQFEFSKAPSYIALSYVWGDPNNSHPVNVNCRDFNVTQNLYVALLHIYELSSIFAEGLARQSRSGQADLFLWIDALCINQGDIDERSKQISRMTAIFASAFTVLVWLGTSEELEPDQLGLEHLLYLLEHELPLVDFPKPVSTVPSSPEQRGSGSDVSELENTYWKIIMSDWFTRVWVLQEYALSQRKPCAMIGDKLFSLESFYTFGAVFSQVLSEKLREDQGILLEDRSDSLRADPVYLTGLILGTTFLGELIASRGFQDKSLANQLLSIIRNQGPKMTTVPHDYIYGLLGMVNLAQLPTQLTPNYRLSYGRVCKDYTRFIIEDTKDLRILMFYQNTVDGEPSWVNGFFLETPWRTEPAVRHTGFFSSDGQSLVVEGVRYGKILSFFSGSEGMTGEQTQQNYDTIFSTAAKIRQQPLADIWKEWFGEFENYVRRVPGDPASRTYSNDPSDDTNGSVAFEFSNACEFALVDDGKIMYCRRHQQQGPVEEYQVWAFKGSTNLSIVHQDGYRYYGWLAVEPDVVLDEEFFSRYEVEQITLI